MIQAKARKEPETATVPTTNQQTILEQPKAEDKPLKQVKTQKAGKAGPVKFSVIPPFGMPVGRESMQFLPCEDVITVEEDGTLVNKQIRFVKGETSIFTDKQREKSKAELIQVRGGELTVNPNEITKLEYLRASNYCSTNPNRDTDIVPLFQEIKIEELKAKQVEEGTAKIKAIQLFSQLEFSDYKVIARNMPEIKNLVRTFGANELTHAVQNLVLTDHNRFLKIQQDPASQVKSDLIEATEFNVISIEGQHVKWADTKNIILSFAVGDSGVEATAAWIVGGEGKETYTEIKKKLRNFGS